MDLSLASKTTALLQFLKDAATIRRKRKPAYSEGDRLLWLADAPKDQPECRSAFFAENPRESPDLWLEVRKGQMPACPPLPQSCRDWVRQPVDQPDHEPDISEETTVLVEREVPNPDAPLGEQRIVLEKVPETRHIENHPEVQDTWLEYLVNHWEPWAREMRRWQDIQQVYESIDFMRRRLEESEERYELVIALGLLQWRDSTGTGVRRHLLTAPAEISLDADRGVVTVSPVASFEKFRAELDMLEIQDQPRLDGTGVDDLLEDLDIEAWDTEKVGRILRVIANRTRSDGQVDEHAWKPLDRPDETLRIVYAPALVLRERNPTAYEELVNRFLKASQNDPSFSTTGPWHRFILEGAPSDALTVEQPGDDLASGDAEHRLYFPMSTNEEQRRIAERLKVRPHVLVKGPPGTGKSRTIANLICHLLASGQRVLVTAHVAKALVVLMEMLPDAIRDLCVTALGSTRDDQDLLKRSVSSIINRRNEWKGELWAQRKITELERGLRELEDKCAQVERGLRECREAETYSHTLAGEYRGTAAQIARQVEQDRPVYGYLADLPDDQVQFPLGPQDTGFLAEAHAQLGVGRRSEILLETGDFLLPNADEFAQALAELEVAETAAEGAKSGITPERFGEVRHLSEESLEELRVFLCALEEHAERASRAFGGLVDGVLKDLLVGHGEAWNRLAHDVSILLKSVEAARASAGAANVYLPSDTDHEQLLEDATRRLEHFERGGRRGWWLLAPRVARETRYIEAHCRVDGQAPVDLESLRKMVAFLQLRALTAQFARVWPAPVPGDLADPRRAANVAASLGNVLNRLLGLFECGRVGCLAAVSVSERALLAEGVERTKWIRLVEAEAAVRRAHHLRGHLDRWLHLIRSLDNAHRHPCMHQMAQAIEERDPGKWAAAWRTREELKAARERLNRYQALLDDLEQACPGLKALLILNEGNPEWTSRITSLNKAWAWSAARTWLRRVTDQSTYRRTEREWHNLQHMIEQRVGELASLKAWRAFFERLDDATSQNLVAWTRAVARIRKGTGPHAYRHRRTAAKYLTQCIPKIPAWVMPLHKLWETVVAHPGLFDTVIVDEASQASIESLLLMLLAKRIVVVGDDKQNSPEAVGVLEDDIARLARERLREFRFRDEFRPDTSLFDHAERAFGNLICLREHFRCVPEIIRFSNELCYLDAPLIPLRQPPPNRLQPLQARFVSGGACEGEGQRIVNRAEADEIVKLVCSCLEDPAFEDKEMGVIVLQGHAQAQLIEKKLAETLTPKIREERKIRCGVPATFQGDQRDVIFLSLVIAPNHRSRALTGLPDERRFNVAMSRAKDQVWLFHSVQQNDLSREDLRRRLLSFFRSPRQGILGQLNEEMDRLERAAKRMPRRPGEQPEPYESWFEVDVALELLRRGYGVRPQYEVASYRIDLAVEGLDSRLAVECDGDTWHGPERYEQDMIRQRQLERAGLVFVRVRESEFYLDRSRTVQQIVQECERLGIRPVDQHEPDALQASSEETVSDVGDGGPSGTAEPDEQERPSGTAVTAVCESDSAAERNSFMGSSEECGFPDPREAPAAYIRAALRRIIEREGPLPRSLVHRMYVEGCPGLHRAGKAVRQALNRALAAMLRSGEVLQEDELGDTSLDSAVVRLAGTPKVRERPRGHRDLEDIPPSELFLVLDRLSASNRSVERDDETLSRSLLAQYEFTRLTAVRRKHLARILRFYRLRQTEAEGRGTKV